MALNLSPKLIFLEKPITNRPDEISDMMSITERVPVAVNYSRRYVKEFQGLVDRISAGEFGNFRTGIGWLLR
jgi:predicted dehydrogenase